MSYTESDYHFHEPPRNNTKQDLKAHTSAKATLHTLRPGFHCRPALHTAMGLLSSAPPLLQRLNTHSGAGQGLVAE